LIRRVIDPEPIIVCEQRRMMRTFLFNKIILISLW